MRQVSLHKQRKVARAVTARKLLILISLLLLLLLLLLAERENGSSPRPLYSALRATSLRPPSLASPRSRTAIHEPIVRSASLLAAGWRRAVIAGSEPPCQFRKKARG